MNKIKWFSNSMEYLANTLISKETNIFWDLFDSRKVLDQYLIQFQLQNDKVARPINYTHLKRPHFKNSSFDFNLSHKEKIGLVLAIVKGPYRIGIDLEDLSQKIDERLFCDNILNNDEKVLFRKNKLSIIFYWSIKEAFFKSIDQDFIPKAVSVCHVSSSNEVILEFKGAFYHGNYLIKGNKLITFVLSNRVCINE